MLLKIKRVEERQGDITVSGSKNSAIPILCAAMLSNDEVIIENVPDITDINTLLSIIQKIGYFVTFENNVVVMKKKRFIKSTIKDEDVKKMRGSYYIMGTLLAKRHKVIIASSGGCDLGFRPINYHLDGFKKMGAKVSQKDNYIHVKAFSLKPCTIDLEFPSVGATINLMLASCKTMGKTTISNCAKEPEIVDVANFLNTMGANITGAGTKVITIHGVKKLYGTTYKVVSDRIEAGTYLILGALLNGAIIREINPQHISSLITVLKNCGYPIYNNSNTITIEKRKSTKPFNVTIGPYPAFPTDLGQPISVLATQIEGNSILKETIFKKRIAHIDELNKMGAKIMLSNDNIIINGVTPISPSTIYANDLRGGAALVLASCLTNDFSYINNIDVFLRGYEKPIEKLASFGIESYLVEQEDGKENIF